MISSPHTKRASLPEHFHSHISGHVQLGSPVKCRHLKIVNKAEDALVTMSLCWSTLVHKFEMFFSSFYIMADVAIQRVSFWLCVQWSKFELIFLFLIQLNFSPNPYVFWVVSAFIGKFGNGGIYNRVFFSNEVYYLILFSRSCYVWNLNFRCHLFFVRLRRTFAFVCPWFPSSKLLRIVCGAPFAKLKDAFWLESKSSDSFFLKNYLKKTFLFSLSLALVDKTQSGCECPLSYKKSAFLSVFCFCSNGFCHTKHFQSKLLDVTCMVILWIEFNPF